jgi:hypothetical protein
MSNSEFGEVQVNPNTWKLIWIALSAGTIVGDIFGFFSVLYAYDITFSQKLFQIGWMFAISAVLISGLALILYIGEEIQKEKEKEKKQ